ncbi:hypothetical protein C8B47_01900 [filamentous cyanobacterium CCP4]|nr:hypothetical protein C8B47_01900 [filamentous cyanobacterium CCP4]
MLTSEQLLQLRELSDLHLLLLYAVAQGLREAKLLSQLIQKHRSTALKYLDQMVDLGFIKVSVKPGTEKKVKPTKFYSVSSEVPLGTVRQIASIRGFDLDDLYQQRLLTDKEETAKAKVAVNPTYKYSSPADKPTERKVSEAEIMTNSSFELLVQQSIERLFSEIEGIKERLSALESDSKERTHVVSKLESLLNPSNKNTEEREQE